MAGASSRARRATAQPFGSAPKPDVGDHCSEARRIRLEFRERLCPVANLNNLKPGFRERSFQEVSSKGVVLDEKQRGGSCHANAPMTERRERTTVRSSVSQASAGQVELTIFRQ